MKILITGITGSLGQAVTKLFLAEDLCGPPKVITGYSRDEFKQAALKDVPYTLYLGDVRDSNRLIEASRGVERIFHFAALKHVDKLESNPEEAIETNVVGTMNVLHAQRHNGIAKVILASTDKAAYPINSYGMTKGLAERLVLRNPNNVVCRYGNVLASRGSVLASLVTSLKTEGKAYLTDPNMTRFWIRLEDAAKFVVSCSYKTGLNTPPMKAASLTLLTECTASVLGINSYYTIQTGWRPGEKMHECLRTSYEGEEINSNTAPQFTREELTELIRPIVKGLQ